MNRNAADVRVRFPGDLPVNVLLVTVMLQFFLLAFAMNDNQRKMAPGQWLPMGIAVIGMAFAGSLLV